MDVSTLNPALFAAAGAEMIPRHPVTNEPLPMTICLKGMDAPEYAAAIRQQLDRRLGGEMPTAETLERDHIDRLVQLTQNWRGMRYEGRDFPHSAENARRLYTEQVWLRDQVQAFAEQRDNFFLSKARRSWRQRLRRLGRWWTVMGRGRRAVI